MAGLLSAATVFLCVSGAQNADDTLERVTTALGWQGRFGTVRTIRMEGTLDGSDITLLARKPTLLRVDIHSGSGAIIQAYDGSFGWQKRTSSSSSPITRLDGEDWDRFVDHAANAIGGPLVDAAQRGTRVEALGNAKVEGQHALRLRLTLLSGTVHTEYLDPTTYLPFRDDIAKKGASSATIHETFSDYKRFEGILFPCHVVRWTDGDSVKHDLRITQVFLNPPIPSDVFTLRAY